MTVKKYQWMWFGGAGHFIGGSQCRFHLTTRVGPWWVSTVGEYFPRSNYTETPDEIGHQRLYETMVFRAAKCSCGRLMCEGWRQHGGNDLDFAAANDAATARANHLRMCKKWARKAGPRPRMYK